MINWIFYLDEVEVEEPLGWSELALNVKRDKDWHGVFFEAASSDLGFIGEGMAYLKDKKATLGFAAKVNFRAVATCSGTAEFDTLIGRVDMRKYKEHCGKICFVSVSIEMESCITTMRNRYDQKVDLANIYSFNQFTVLPTYARLNFGMELPAQELEARVEGYVPEDGDSQTAVISLIGEEEGVIIRPLYSRVLYNSINKGQLNDAAGLYQDQSEFAFPLSPQLLYDDVVECFQGEFSYTIRLKGSATGAAGLTALSEARIIVGYWNATDNPAEIFTDLTILHDVQVDDGQPEGVFVVNFDETFNGTVALPPGAGLYAYLFLDLDSLEIGIDIDYTFDGETYFLVTAVKSCPTSQAQVSMIHETGSRIVESITDYCLTMKSDYYGRPDSQPHAAAADGCGALRVLSSGLRIRQAENPTHFMSLKDFFDGLRGIDNIGMGIEPDTDNGGDRQWLRVEPVEYFYQGNNLVLTIDAVPEADDNLDPTEAYSTIDIGYRKWETQNFNGLDEFNSNKRYRTSLETINNPLDALSPFVAGGYPIELTRQQSYAEAGGADTSYDNETFIICVMRDAYDFLVEQGKIDTEAGFFSFGTAYNWRIRPYYNLMRWWKSVAQSYVNFSNWDSRLIFTSGTGNLLAEGQIEAGDPCKLENGSKRENRDLAISDFAVPQYPIWKPETRTVNGYPLSLNEYNIIKANPYGYFSVQCGSGDFVKCFLVQCIYKPAQGLADFIFKIKYE